MASTTRSCNSTGYRLPDLVKSSTRISRSRPISATIAHGIVLSNAAAAGRKGLRLRRRLLGRPGMHARSRPTSYRSPIYGTAVADSQGHACVTFPLPDDLTTWRVMAVAVGTDDAHFGTNDATFISTQPLITQSAAAAVRAPATDSISGVRALVANQTERDASLALMPEPLGARSLSRAAIYRLNARPTSRRRADHAAYRFPVTSVRRRRRRIVHREARRIAISDAFKVPFDGDRDRATTDRSSRPA